METIKIRFFYIHGINTSNKLFHQFWSLVIEDVFHQYKNSIFRDLKIDENNLKVELQHIPIKWKSKSWIHDLQLIGLSKYFRDQVVDKIITNLKDNNSNSYNMFISHSFGSVWIYKAISRMIDRKIKIIPHWNVMVGGALGGTNLPFGGIYIKTLREKHQIYNKPEEIKRWINLFNKDDYVSTNIYGITGLENIEINHGVFNPGLKEHDAMYYLESENFKSIVKDFIINSLKEYIKNKKQITIDFS